MAVEPARPAESWTNDVQAPSKSECVADAIPAFIEQDGGPSECVQWVARKGEVVESRAALRPAEHLQRDLATKMCGARDAGAAITHRVVHAGRRAPEVRKFVEGITDGAAPRMAYRHIAEAREHAQ